LESHCSGCGATFDPPPRRVSVAQVQTTKYKDPTENRTIVAVLSLACLGILFYGAWLFRQGMSSFIAGADGNTHSVQRGSFQTPSSVETSSQTQTPPQTQPGSSQMPYDPDSDPDRDWNWEGEVTKEDILLNEMESNKASLGYAFNEQYLTAVSRFRWIYSHWPQNSRLYSQSHVQSEHPWLHAHFDQELINESAKRYRVR
jgi:hypothetical protein